MAQPIVESVCSLCGGKYELKDKWRCVNGCVLLKTKPSFLGRFDLEIGGVTHVVFFSYVSRCITKITINGYRSRVDYKVYRKLFHELTQICGYERQNKIGPFWGKGGPCYKERD